MDNILEVANISKDYNGKCIVKALSFNLRKGRTGCLLGESGCGKTTVLRCIAGFEHLHTGDIFINGRLMSSPHNCIPPEARRLGMVFQDYALFPHLSLRNNITFGLDRMSKPEQRKRVMEMLDLVGLVEDADKYPHELSGGQQQRVAIARSLAMNPEVMLFDEVTAALDPETVKEVLVTIRDLAEEGMTCLLVTHEMGFARELADHMYFTDNGVIVEHGPPREFFEAPKDPRTKEFLSQIL